jgi:CrcB protein
MRKIFFIGAGGMLGALARQAFRLLPLWKSAGNLPWDTLFINVLGSFLLCFLLSIPLDRRSFAFDLRLGAGIGFLGAFTTFSTFCKEILFLWEGGETAWAAGYAGLSLLLGLTAAFLGFSLGGLLFFRPPGRFSGNEEGDGR